MPVPRGARRRLATGFALWLALWLATTVATAEIRVPDDRGETLVLDAPATRIISLAPHLTENLFAIGAGDSLVGVTTYSNYPPAAARIEIIGTYKDFDIERIVELDPDVVLGWTSGNPDEPIRRMQRIGLPLFLSEPREPAHVAEELRKLGALTGREAVAGKVADDFMHRITALRARYAHRDPVTVFYEVWNDPLITLNGEHLISKLLTGCGAVNVFAELASLAPRVSVEAVLERDPEAIITGGMGDRRPEWLADWLRYDFLRAAARDNLFHVHPDLVQRHTTRLADGMAALCELVETARGRRLP